MANTGNVSLSLSGLTDTNCTNIAGGAPSLTVGAKTTFTCEHPLTSVGSWTNKGTITGTPPSGPGINHTSNQVVVNVPSNPASPSKRSRSSRANTRRRNWPGRSAKRSHSQIIVTNTGNVPLKINSTIDTNCTGMSGGASEIGVHGSAIFTCEHTLTSVGPYVNEATVVGNEKPQTSNKVVVQVAAQAVKAQCAIDK